MIADYKPNVRCDATSTPGPPWTSVVSLFSNMRASKQFRVFGLLEEAGVQESLPLTLDAGKTSIAVVITPQVKGNGMTDILLPFFFEQPIERVN